MIKPEQVPEDVVSMLIDTLDYYGASREEMQIAIAAALNAWPGMLRPFAGTEFAEVIILPLKQENTDDR